MILLYLILILINITQIDSSLDSCRQTFGSNKYDLNQLNHLTIFGEDIQGYRYALTPCGLVPTDKCGKNVPPSEQGMTACQERISDTGFSSSMGYMDGYGKSPNLAFSENPQGPGTGVLMTMRNAQCNGRERLVNVTFICDKSAGSPTKMDVVEDPSCVFIITLKAAEACPLGGSVTGGTIFIIILLVVIIIYLLGGISYNRFKNKQTGLAVLPHTSFWLLVIGLFTTGCKFTWNFIRHCGQRTYDSV